MAKYDNTFIPRRMTIQDEYDLIKVTSFYNKDENQKVSIIPTAEMNTPKVVSDVLNPESVLPPPPNRCLLDIVIAIDLSGSCRGPGHPQNPAPYNTTANTPPTPSAYNWYGAPGSPYEAQRIMLEEIIKYLEPGMVAGEVQVGVVFYAVYARGLNPDGLSMSSSFIGDLCPVNTANDPRAIQNPVDGTWHSRISRKMYWAYVNANIINNQPSTFLGVGTDIHSALDETIGGMQLNNKMGSAFGSVGMGFGNSHYPVRRNDPDFKQVAIIITDSTATPQESGFSWPQAQITVPLGTWDYLGIGGQTWPCESHWVTSAQPPPPYWGCFGVPFNGGSGPDANETNRAENSTMCQGQSDLYPSNPYNTNGPSDQKIIGVVVRDADFMSLSNTAFFQPTGTNAFGSYNDNSKQAVKDTLDCITCRQNGGTNPWNTTLTGGTAGFYVDIGNPAAMHNSIAEIVGEVCWTAGDLEYECSGPTGSGIFPAWWCFTPGPGIPTTNGWTHTQCLANCSVPVPVTYNCVMDVNGLPACNPIYNNSGMTLSQCLLVCQGSFVQVDPGLDVPDTWKCYIPPSSAIGSCTKVFDGSGYPTEQDCLDNCLIHNLPPFFPITTGYNCDNTTGSCSGPVFGGSYPTLAACQATCGTLPIGTANPLDCYETKSCPCGWDWFVNPITGDIMCDPSTVTGGPQSGMNAIGRTCMQIENPQTTPFHDIPVPGDIWEHSPPVPIPNTPNWTKVYVVTSTIGVTGTPNLETRANPPCDIPTPL